MAVLTIATQFTPPQCKMNEIQRVGVTSIIRLLFISHCKLCDFAPEVLPLATAPMEVSLSVSRNLSFIVKSWAPKCNADSGTIFYIKERGRIKDVFSFYDYGSIIKYFKKSMQKYIQSQGCEIFILEHISSSHEVYNSSP